MKKKIFIIGLIMGIVLGLIIGYALFSQEETKKDSNKDLNIYLTKNNNSGLRICPDVWVDDREPPYSPIPEERQYFIIDGQNRNLNNFDINWVKDNCEVNSPEIVY